MPNSIKYSITGDTQSLRKGNWYIGVGDVSKATTSTTGHWAGIAPPTSGYTIYENKSVNGPSIRVPANNSTLIDYAGRLYSGSNISTVYSAITYLNTNTTTIVVNKDYETIVTSGMVYSVDAGFTPSFYTSGSTWNDISLSGGTTTLFNSPSYSGTSGGFLRFSKASSQYATNPNIGSKSVWTLEAWVRFNSSLTGQVGMVVGNQYNGASSLNFTIGTNGAPGSYNIQVGFFDGSWRNTTGFAPALNTWYQIVGTYDGSVIRQYVNGSASGGTLNYVGTPTSGGEIRLMRRWDDVVSSTNLIDGDLSIVRIYDRALSASEVLQNYNAQISRFTPVIGANLVFDLDAANYSAMPTNGSTIAGTGAYTITMTNTNSSMSWNSSNGGVFRKSTANTSDLFLGGPNYSTASQPYTVFMAYKWDGGTIGRLLNANSASPDWLLGLWGAPAARMDIAFNGAFVGSNSTAADTAWHFIWFSNDGLNTTNSSKSYIATNIAPSGTNGTRNASGGFNGLRLFGRYSTATTSSEPVTADVAFVKVWDGALTLAEIQSLHSFYKARMGY